MRRTRAEDHEEEEPENAYEDGGDEDIPADKAQQVSRSTIHVKLILNACDRISNGKQET